jgi:hypothetical protein
VRPMAGGPALRGHVQPGRSELRDGRALVRVQHGREPPATAVPGGQCLSRRSRRTGLRVSPRTEARTCFGDQGDPRVPGCPIGAAGHVLPAQRALLSGRSPVLHGKDGPRLRATASLSSGGELGAPHRRAPGLPLSSTRRPIPPVRLLGPPGGAQAGAGREPDPLDRSRSASLSELAAVWR